MPKKILFFSKSKDICLKFIDMRLDKHSIALGTPGFSLFTSDRLSSTIDPNNGMER
jgi:hypothetical protein